MIINTQNKLNPIYIIIIPPQIPSLPEKKSEDIHVKSLETTINITHCPDRFPIIATMSEIMITNKAKL